MEAVLEILRQRDRVACHLGVLAQRLGYEQPVEIGADRKADADPAGGNAGQICRARQTHQQPAGHIGRLRTHRSDPGAELSSAEEVFGRGLILADKIHADTEHKNQIDAECGYGYYAVCHHFFTLHFILLIIQEIR